MPPRREDGLGRILFPFDAAALVIAVVLTVRTGVVGLWRLPVLVGFFLLAFVLCVVAYYFVIFLISLTVDMKKPVQEDHPLHRRIVFLATGHICRAARLCLRTEGWERLPKGRFLVVSNHRSAYDPIAAVWALRKASTVFITKPENYRIPVAGPMICSAGFLSIDREDPREAMKTIQNAANLLRSDTVSVGVYPEGTRNREPEKGLLPFHNGVFKIAQRAEVPLVVMTVRGSENIRENWPWRPTDVTLRICAVIPPEELKGPTAEVSRRAREIMERDLAAE